ncbi:MAG: hypothetical protein ACKO1N_07950 [Erythrobacter sp.]
MSWLSLVLAHFGLGGFVAGVYASAVGQQGLGTALMGLGLLVQVIALVRIKRERKQAAQDLEQRERSDARG